MRFGPIYFTDKTGCEIELRNAEVSDAADLIQYLRITAGESPYLIREPEEVRIEKDQEEDYIRKLKESDKDLMLLAFAGGKHVGNCSFTSIGKNIRYAHRCEAAIALYREFWGRGIGKIMMETLLKEAKGCGYEQAELQVMCKNENAAALYKNLGFRIYGTMPRNMKYRDGTFGDAYWMMKQL